MSKQAQARDAIAHRLVDDIFNDLWFKDLEMRNIMYESYVINIPQMNIYAHFERANNLRDYYAEIERILLNTPGLCEVKRRRAKHR